MSEELKKRTLASALLLRVKDKADKTVSEELKKHTLASALLLNKKMKPQNDV